MSALLADAVLKPRFDKADWTMLTAQTVDWLNGREADLPGVAGRAAKAALIPQVPGKAGRRLVGEGAGIDHARRGEGRLQGGVHAEGGDLLQRRPDAGRDGGGRP